MTTSMDKILSLAKRRGFVFLSSEIYGGFSSCYDFGPLGVELKRNIKRSWWREMVRKHQNIVGLDSAILMNPKVWEASGHLGAGFADQLVECKECHKRFKKEEVKDKCPSCSGELMEPQQFNLMMKTHVGPVEKKASETYLRPETCQGIYVNFKNILNSTRLKIPFGVAQIGKAFRNEISPGNFIYRTREFEQMEMQWFCNPEAKKSPNDWFDYWQEQRINWYLDLGIKKENLRAREIPEEERAHYAKKQIDLEYKFPFASSAASPAGRQGRQGWQEIEGIHNRGDWDLSNHAKHSGEDLKYYDEEEDKKYFPHVIETSVGVDRSFLAFLCEAYQEEKVKGEKRVVLKLNPDLAPIEVAVFPLLANKPKLVEKAREVYEMLKPEFRTTWDERGNIGKRYYSQDEIGTFLCVTCDFETLKRDDVTIRNRDSMEQIRVKISNLKKAIQKILQSPEEFSKLGKPVK